MKKMITITAIVLGTLSANAMAHHVAAENAKERIALKDGTTLYIFNDGTMAMEDRLGRATAMKIGEKMEAQDGNVITMQSDASAKLRRMIKSDHSNK